MNLITKLWNDESGQGMVEYGLIIAVVAVVAIVGLGVFGEQLSTFFDSLSNRLPANP